MWQPHAPQSEHGSAASAQLPDAAHEPAAATGRRPPVPPLRLREVLSGASPASSVRSSLTPRSSLRTSVLRAVQGRSDLSDRLLSVTPEPLRVPSPMTGNSAARAALAAMYADAVAQLNAEAAPSSVQARLPLQPPPPPPPSQPPMRSGRSARSLSLVLSSPRAPLAPYAPVAVAPLPMRIDTWRGGSVPPPVPRPLSARRPVSARPSSARPRSARAVPVLAVVGSAVVSAPSPAQFVERGAAGSDTCEQRMRW
jgi:hypothetical protein